MKIKLKNVKVPSEIEVLPHEITIEAVPVWMTFNVYYHEGNKVNEDWSAIEQSIWEALDSITHGYAERYLQVYGENVVSQKDLCNSIFYRGNRLIAAKDQIHASTLPLGNKVFSCSGSIYLTPSECQSFRIALRSIKRLFTSIDSFNVHDHSYPRSYWPVGLYYHGKPIAAWCHPETHAWSHSVEDFKAYNATISLASIPKKNSVSR